MSDSQDESVVSEVISELDEAAFIIKNEIEAIFINALDMQAKKSLKLKLYDLPIHEKYDHQKLLEYYDQLILENDLVQKKNDMLTQNLLVHFKLKKDQRALCEDNEEMVSQLDAKYRSTLDQMDEMIAQNNQVHLKIKEKDEFLDQLQLQLKSEQNELITQLTKLLRETGTILQSVKSGLFLSENALSKILRQITNVRNILTEERIAYILTLDEFTKIDQKAKALENLGNNLRMIDFEQLHAERQILGEKIEERNNDLDKLRLRYFSDTQILSHVRQKNCMIDQQINDENLLVSYSYDELIETRKYANDMQIKRDNLRKQYTDLSESCGLLNKKKLLQDYDGTVNDIDKGQTHIDELKDEINLFENEYENVMIQIDARALHKTDSQLFDEQLEKQVEIMNRPITPRILKGIPIKRNFLKRN